MKIYSLDNLNNHLDLFNLLLEQFFMKSFIKELENCKTQFFNRVKEDFEKAIYCIYFKRSSSRTKRMARK